MRHRALNGPTIGSLRMTSSHTNRRARHLAHDEKTAARLRIGEEQLLGVFDAGSKAGVGPHPLRHLAWKTVTRM
jgi:hypothetical protein